MLTLIENGEVWAPEPLGRRSVLLVGDRVASVAGAGDVDARAASRALGLEVEVIDAAGCLVVPGFIDPHIHLIGGSGEKGFASRAPAIQLSELIPWGITTVVGCLGVDATTRSPISLLAQVKGLREDGLSAFLYTGHYGIPPATITGSVRNDLLIIEEVIGVGEIAVSDHRAPQPSVEELARVVVDSHVGGILSRKAGVTHFHMGEGKKRMAPLFALLDEYDIEPASLYASHVHRTPELLDEAVELARRGAFVDMDTADQDLGKWIRYYLDHGGDPHQLTVSSDADSNSPRLFFEKVRAAVLDHGLPLERVLPFVTTNTAKVLKLQGKGRLEPGRDADLVVLRKGSLEIVHVIARGRFMVFGGEPAVLSKAVEESNRELHLVGTKDEA